MRRPVVRLPGLAVVLAAALLWVMASGPGMALSLAQRAASPMTSPIAAGRITITGMVKHPGPVTVADLQQLPSETVKVTYQAGGGSESHTFTGVRLWDVLQQVGLVVSPD